MYASLKALSIVALAGLVAGTQITVKNQCGADVHVGQLKNGESQPNTQVVAQGSQYTYELPADWQGRFWGRSDCEGNSCNAIAGAADPASLAEITFKGHAGYDYYDLSFVDGFNLPIKMYPVNGNKDSDDQYRCGAPACGNVPSCPDGMKVYGNNGNVVGCKSACSAFGTDGLCCAGAHNTPDTCGPNEYSNAVKAACSDAYSYAYDDTTSTFMCQAETYEIVFCP